MYRSFSRRVCLGLIAFGCGSPGDLDRSQFPELDNTGYPDRVGAAGAGGTLGGSGGGNPGGSNSGGTAGAGGSGVGTGGTTPSGGAGGSLGGSGTGGQSGSSGQAGTAGQGGTGSDPGGCPEDITVLLNRPSSEGGCAGGGCHVPQGTPPDLTSPGVEARVFNVLSNCGGRPYIGPNDSFIEDKLTNTSPQCGSQMPLFATNNLSDEDQACILEWIDEVAAGM